MYFFCQYHKLVQSHSIRALKVSCSLQTVQPDPPEAWGDGSEDPGHLVWNSAAQGQDAEPPRHLQQGDGASAGTSAAAPSPVFWWKLTFVPGVRIRPTPGVWLLQSDTLSKEGVTLESHPLVWPGFPNLFVINFLFLWIYLFFKIWSDLGWLFGLLLSVAFLFVHFILHDSG